MTAEQKKTLAEVVLRTRRWAFREALPEIARTVNGIVAERDREREERTRGADRMIRDYRELIVGEGRDA